MVDPRFIMAEVYRHPGLTDDEKQQFTNDINECDSPESAYMIAEEYIKIGDEYIEDLADASMGDVTYGYGGRG